MDRKRSFDQMEDSSVVVAYEFSESEKCSLRESVEDQEKFRGLDKLDITTKKSALKASAFVVSLISFSGWKTLRHACSGRVRTLSLSMECASPNFFDCIELLTSSCNITKSGEGAPVINLSGEVFGIAYYECGRSSVFLPMQVANMWWEHYKQHKEMRHLAYGFEGGRLYSAMLPFLETFSANFPRINDGVRVTNVLPESFAESAGLLENDFILKCDGKSVKSFLELWGLMWDKVGDAVELQVARLGLDAIQIIRMAVGEADEFNKWPRYDY